MDKNYHIIHCRFCGTETGRIEISPIQDLLDGNPKSDAYHGIEDSRCDKCQKEHGSYKEMHDEFLQHGGTHPDFIIAIKKAGYKKCAEWDKTMKLRKEEHEKKLAEPVDLNGARKK